MSFDRGPATECSLRVRQSHFWGSSISERAFGAVEKSKAAVATSVLKVEHGHGRLVRAKYRVLARDRIGGLTALAVR